MNKPLLKSIALGVSLMFACSSPAFSADSELKAAIQQDYDSYLKDLFIHFHQNPELSLVETQTAARLAQELRLAGFEVTEGVGVAVDGFPATGIVAMMENGPGPLVMMRADMDGLPVKEDSGLEYASQAMQISPINGENVPVMHACGHDVHITSLVGTARYMAENKDQWSGTLMLIGQPAEERLIGAKQMMDADIWSTFGKPDYALAFHVGSALPTGVVNVIEGAPYAGADTVDITIHGVGAHGASPHAGKDPIVLGSQIVLALQTLVSRELSPREAGVVTVGSFRSGTTHNIISDRAELELTVRNTNLETREKLLTGIERIAENMGRVAGMPEDKLPEMKVVSSTPPTVNDATLASRLKSVWADKMGEELVLSFMPTGMGAEDFPYFTTTPQIESVYWAVGGTNPKVWAEAQNGGAPIPSHHSPFFKVEPESVKVGVESTVYALMELMPKT
ncbi:amidohydrolase [Glaciecola sp. XM2]|uniref:amidohydrolase n=1 Tax=Glaciecola sp. XM2 TaxID=1914931 RepID=UPI001BDE794E|nr:amidohydrolase [Glaciecola sp. XM2]MBT1449965.1 amidohydrolase [Glaciecola sp. XM2]